MDGNSHKLDITKFITNDTQLELISWDEENTNFDLSEDTDADSQHYNILLNMTVNTKKHPHSSTVLVLPPMFKLILSIY